MVRQIKRSSRFKSDFKTVLASISKSKRLLFQERLANVLECLAQDQPLPKSLEDHPLSHNWSGYRDCHIFPDIVLIYKKTEKGELKLLLLARIGSHSELRL